MKIKYTPKNTVFVTGSVPTGSRIMAAGAKGIKNVTLGTEATHAIVFFFVAKFVQMLNHELHIHDKIYIQGDQINVISGILTDVGIFLVLNVMANINCGFYHYFTCL